MEGCFTSIQSGPSWYWIIIVEEKEDSCFDSSSSEKEMVGELDNLDYTDDL